MATLIAHGPILGVLKTIHAGTHPRDPDGARLGPERRVFLRGPHESCLHLCSLTLLSALLSLVKERQTVLQHCASWFGQTPQEVPGKGLRSTLILGWCSVNQAALRGLEPPHSPILTTPPSCSGTAHPEASTLALPPAFLHLLGVLSHTLSLGTSCVPAFLGRAPFATVAAVTPHSPPIF